MLARLNFRGAVWQLRVILVLTWALSVVVTCTSKPATPTPQSTPTPGASPTASILPNPSATATTSPRPTPTASATPVSPTQTPTSLPSTPTPTPTSPSTPPEIELLGELRLPGLPVEDVDIAVHRGRDTAAVLTEKIDLSGSWLHQTSLRGTLIGSTEIAGLPVYGVDPLVINQRNLFTAATISDTDNGILHLVDVGATSSQSIMLDGRPVNDVDLLSVNDQTLVAPLQGRMANLHQVRLSDRNVVTTQLPGILKAGVDPVLRDSAGTLLVATTDENLAGSWLNRVIVGTGQKLTSIHLPGLLVSDVDPVLSSDEKTVYIALASFEGTVGHLAIVDLASGAVTDIYLPGKPLLGIDPVLVEGANRVVVALANMHGNFDRIAIVDLASEQVSTTDLPGMLRADVDLLLTGSAQYILAATEGAITRINLGTAAVQSFPLPGVVPTNTDIRLVDNRTALIAVQPQDTVSRSFLIRLDIMSGQSSTWTLPGALQPGVDFLDVPSQTPFMLITAAVNAQETVLSSWRLGAGDRTLIATRDGATNRTVVSTFDGANLRSDEELGSVLVSAVDFWSQSSDGYFGADEDFIPIGGSCGCDNETRKDDEREPQRAEQPPTGIPLTDDGGLDLTGTIGSDLANLIGNLDGMTATSFDDVIFAGGVNKRGTYSDRTVIVDPTTGKGVEGPRLLDARAFHTAVTLPSGEVMFTGGKGQGGTALRSTEIFDGKTIKRGPGMQHRRIGASTTLMQSGEVLVTGGTDSSGTPVQDAEIFDPRTGAWRAGGQMHLARSFHQTVVGADGSVWILGGETPSGITEMVERFEPGSQTFASAGRLRNPRSRFETVELGDGRVVVAGGLTLRRAPTLSGEGGIEGRGIVSPFAGLAQSAAVVVEPASAMPGQIVMFTITGFQPGEEVEIAFGGETLASGFVDDFGALELTGSIPAGIPSGEHPMEANGSFGTLFELEYSVLASVPTVSIDPAGAYPGQAITVTGSGFVVGESVQVYTSDFLLASVTADSAGTFELATVLNKEVPPGSTELVAIGNMGSESVTPYVVIEAPAPTPTPTQTPEVPGGPAPAVYVEPSEAGTGWLVDFQVDNFAPGELVKIQFAGQTIAEGNADDKGQVAISGRIPELVPAGFHPLDVTGSEGSEVTIEYEVVAYSLSDSVEIWDTMEGFSASEFELDYGLLQPFVFLRSPGVVWIAGGRGVDGESEEVHALDTTTGQQGLVSTTGTRGRTVGSTTTRRKPGESLEPLTTMPRERGPVTRPRYTPTGTTPDDEEVDEDEDPVAPSSGAIDTGDPVHLNSGEFFIAETDYFLPGRGGMDLSFVRTYRSRISYLGSLGHNWDHNYNERMLPRGDGDYEHHSGGGSITVYKRQLDGSYVGPVTAFSTLTSATDGTARLRDRYGLVKEFGKDGRLLKIVDRMGNANTLNYDSGGRLVAIRDPYDRTLTLTYNRLGLIVLLQDFAGRLVRYRYNDNQELIAVTSHAVTATPAGNDFPLGKTTRFTYAGCGPGGQLHHNLLTVTRPNEVVSGGSPYLVNEYGATPDTYSYDKLVRQFEGGVNDSGVHAGGEVRYLYAELNVGLSPSMLNIARNRTTVTDKNGNTSVYEHNVSGGEVRVAFKAGNQRPIDNSTDPAFGTDPSEIATVTQYNSDGLVIRVTHPLGNSFEHMYDSNNPDPLQRGNIIERTLTPDAKRGGKPEILGFEYEPIFNQVRAIMSPLANDPLYQPPVGTWSADRYVSSYVYDYQEGNSIAQLAARTYMSESEISGLLTRAGIPMSLGDTNGDGLTNQVLGSIIVHQTPAVLLPDWSSQRVVEGGDLQGRTITYTQNQFGQVTRQVDPSGSVQLNTYYQSGDPDGDGKNIKPGKSSTGGYLKTVIKDAELAAGRMSTAAPLRAATTRQYNEFGNVIATVDGNGNTSREIYNERAQLVRTISPAPESYEVDYFYDANDNLVRVDIQNVRPDSNGVNRVDAANSHFTTEFIFDILDQVVQIREESTEPTLPSGATPPESFRNRFYRYDPNGNRVSTQLPDGSVSLVAFDAFDRIFMETFAAGTPVEANEVSHYDANGNIVLWVDAEDHGAADIWRGDPTFFYYDGNDRQIGEVDALGNVYRTEFNAGGELMSNRIYDGQDGRNPDRLFEGHSGVLVEEMLYSFDEVHRLFETRYSVFPLDAPGASRTVIQRDEFNRGGLSVRIIDEDGEALVRSYDPLGGVTSETDEFGNSNTYRYDAAHNVLSVTTRDVPDPGLGAPVVRTASMVYDNQGRRIRTIDAVGNTQYFRFDSRDNIVWQADATGALRSDPLGRVSGQINGPGNVTNLYYNAFSDEVSRETVLREGGKGTGAVSTNHANPDGAISESRTYNLRGQLSSFTDDTDAAAASTTRLVYDERGRLVVEVKADGTEVRSSFDADGLPQVVTDAAGNRFTYVYDDLGRMLELRVNRAIGVAGTTLQRFTYDGRGNLTTAFDNNTPTDPSDDHLVRFKYDSRKAILSTDQDGYEISASRDDEGLVDGLRYSDGATLTFTRDEIDRLRSATLSSSQSPPMLAEFDYAERVGQATVRTGPGIVSRFDRDPAGRPGRFTHTGTSSSGTTFDATYLYDRSGKRSATVYENLGGEGDVYRYDSTGRLTEVAYGVPDPIAEIAQRGAGGTAGRVISYVLDGAGNQLEVSEASSSSTETASVNNLNQYVMFSGSMITYSADGLTLNDANNKYRFDAFGRLVDVEVPADRSRVSYTYDAAGRRVTETVQTGSSDPVSYRRVYWGTEVLEEWQTDPVASLKVRFGQSLFRQVRDDLDYDSDGDRTEYIAYTIADDILGSTMAAVGTNGNVLEQYSYDAYGEPTILSGDGTETRSESLIGNSTLFTGYRWEAATGLYYAITRDYDPRLRRFLQPDSVGMGGGANLYEYANGDPINVIDPIGTSGVKAFAATLENLAAETPPQFADVAKALIRIREAVGRKILEAYRKNHQNPGILRDKMGALNDMIDEMTRSLAERYNAYEKARAQAQSGVQFNWKESLAGIWTLTITGASFLPIVGDVIDAVGLVTGFDIATLTELSLSERAMMGAALLVGSGTAMVQALRTGKKVLSSADNARSATRACGGGVHWDDDVIPGDGNGPRYSKNRGRAAQDEWVEEFDPQIKGSNPGNVQENQAIGDMFRDQLATRLEQKPWVKKVEIEVHIDVGELHPGANPRRIDVRVTTHQDKVRHFEAKWGGSEYTVVQQAKDRIIEQQTGVRTVLVRGGQDAAVNRRAPYTPPQP